MKKAKKYIYLISPNRINNKTFYIDLHNIFKLQKVSFFQLRLKKESSKKIFFVGKRIKKLCKKFNVKLIINDDPNLAKRIGADGCHIGQSDSSISQTRKLIGDKIVGVTCHNSKKLVIKSIDEGASYVAIGAFYSSKTKKIKHRATIKLLKDVKKITKIPVVAIGGIKFNNYKKLLLNNANFLAISSYIWNNKKFTPLEAIRKLK